MYSLWQGDTCYHLHPTHRRWKDLSFVYYKYSDSLKWLNTSRCVSFVCSPHLLLHSAGARGRGFPLHLSFITHSSAALHDPALHLTVAPDCSVSSGDSPANFPRDSSRVLLCCLLRPCSPKRPLKYTKINLFILHMSSSLVHQGQNPPHCNAKWIEAGKRRERECSSCGLQGPWNVFRQRCCSLIIGTFRLQTTGNVSYNTCGVMGGDNEQKYKRLHNEISFTKRRLWRLSASLTAKFIKICLNLVLGTFLFSLRDGWNLLWIAWFDKNESVELISLFDWSDADDIWLGIFKIKAATSHVGLNRGGNSAAGHWGVFTAGRDFMC